MNKIKEAWMYLSFGVLTTVVDYVAAMLFFEVAGLGELTSNNIAWLISVIFAYITNKIFVFESKSMQLKILCREILSFVSARIITLLLADAMIWAATKMDIAFVVAKIVSSVMVVILNYVFSKVIIFRKKQEEQQ